ncbi:hypothetical protein LCGC14_2279650, partial [marine sediment metagenome]
MITQTDIDKAHERFTTFDSCSAACCPTPTRTFELDEECRVGNLNECVIKEIIFDGKAYRIEYRRSPSRDDSDPQPMTAIRWWHDVNKTTFCGKAAPMFKPHLPGQISTSTIDTLFHMMGSGGLVCDPRYQRGYVWTIEDQRALIDSIFNRINIGTFVFSRHAGFRDEKTDNITKFLNLDGDEIEPVIRSLENCSRKQEDNSVLSVQSPHCKIPQDCRYWNNSPQKSLLDPAISYVVSHIHQKITERDVADVCKMSPFKFSRSFKKSYGVTFQDYLISARMEKASRLLTNPNVLVADVANQVG